MPGCDCVFKNLKVSIMCQQGDQCKCDEEGAHWNMKKKPARWIVAEKRHQVLNTFDTWAWALLTSKILIFFNLPIKLSDWVDFIWILPKFSKIGSFSCRFYWPCVTLRFILYELVVFYLYLCEFLIDFQYTYCMITKFNIIYKTGT